MLDIGAATALLSVFASHAGATQVYACEHNSFLLQIAEQVLKLNRIKNVKLIDKHSSQLTLDDIDGSKVCVR